MTSENTSELIWGAPLSIKAAGHVALAPSLFSGGVQNPATIMEAKSFSLEEKIERSSSIRSVNPRHWISTAIEQSAQVAQGPLVHFSGVGRLDQGARNSSVISSPINAQILERCRKRFVQIATTEDIEYGHIAPSEILLSEYFEQYGSIIGEIVQHIYLTEIGKKSVLIALLKSLSSRRYKSVYPYGQTIAVAALASQSPEVREAGIRAFENWGHREGIDVLKALTVTPNWLDDYRLDTIEYLESLA